MEKRRAYHRGYYRLTLRHGPFRQPKRLRGRRRAADVRIPFTAQDFARKRDRIIETAEISLELRQRMMVSNARRAGAAVIRSREMRVRKCPCAGTLPLASKNTSPFPRTSSE